MLLTPESLAERWQVSPALIRKMLAKGDLPGFRLGGKLWRIRQADVEAIECPTSDYSGSVVAGPSQNTSTDSARPVVGLKAAMQQARRQSSAA